MAFVARRDTAIDGRRGMFSVSECMFMTLGL